MNKIAIAPTYTIQNIMAINSTPINNNKAETLAKVKTKKNTE